MLPLEGIQVIEVGQVIAAPYTTLLLADLGADVIKVERPGSGDSARDPQVTDLGGVSATFLTFNRNKRSVVLDLKDPVDHRAFLALTREADVFVNNLVPEAARRLRVDHDSLRAFNNRLITCSISGFGADSPNADLPSYDLIHQAMAGYMQITGSPDDPPVRLGIPFADLAAALFAAYGILGALRARETTGQGDEISISLHDCMLSLLTYQATMYLTAGVEPQRMGSAHEFVIPWQAFATADGHLVVASRTNSLWPTFCSVLGVDELSDDPRFQTNESRLEHRAELVPMLAACFEQRTTAAWLNVLQIAGIPCAPVNGMREAFDDPHVAARSMIDEMDHPTLGRVRLPANPVRYRDASLATPAPPPELGVDQHLLRGGSARRRTTPKDTM